MEGLYDPDEFLHVAVKSGGLSAGSEERHVVSKGSASAASAGYSSVSSPHNLPRTW